MKIDTFESKTIKKIHSYVENKTQFLSKFQAEIDKKRAKLANLKENLAKEEELFLVDFDPETRKKINKLKKEMAELKREIEEDEQFKEISNKNTLNLTDEDLNELEEASNNVVAKHYKLFDEVLKKKDELIQAILKFDEEYSELHELQEEIRNLCMSANYNHSTTEKVLKSVKIINQEQIKSIGNDIANLIKSVPLSKRTEIEGIKVKALCSFAGRVTMNEGEYGVIYDKKLADQLIKNGTVIKIN